MASFMDLVPAAQELYLLAFFLLGFVLFRAQAVKKLISRKPERLPFAHTVEHLNQFLISKQYEQVLVSWPLLDEYTPEALCMVVTAILGLGRPEDVGLFVAKAHANLPHLRSSIHKVIAAIASPECKVSTSTISTALKDVLTKNFKTLDTEAIAALAVAFAKVNDETNVDLLLKWLKDQPYVDMPKVLEQVVYGFLGCNNLDAVFMHLKKVKMTPSSEDLVCAIAKNVVEEARESSHVDAPRDIGRKSYVGQLLRTMESTSCMPAEALMKILMSAAQCGNAALAARAEKHLRAVSDAAIPQEAFIALLQVEMRLCLTQHNSKSLDRPAKLFDELAEAYPDLDESILLNLVMACGVVGESDLAERIASWALSKGLGTSPMISAVVKTLSMSKDPSRIWGVCEKALAMGIHIEPELSGQLIKFACKGKSRFDLACQLYEIAECPTTQLLVCLIRAATQVGNSEMLHKLWNDALNQDKPVDTAVGNAIMWGLQNLKDFEKVTEIFLKMRELGCLDVESYNVMLKTSDYVDVSERESISVEKLMEEMRQAGIEPGASTQHAILSSAVNSGHFDEVSSALDRMESNGFQIDAFTLCTIFKGCKRSAKTFHGYDFDRYFALVKKYNVEMEEVLAAAIVEACLCLNDGERIKTCVAALERMGWTVSTQSHASTQSLMMKAYSQMKDLASAKKIWNNFLQSKVGEPSEFMYAQMIDVLVTSRKIDEALAIFQQMRQNHANKPASRATSIAYAMIIKGFAHQKDSVRALKCYEEMKIMGVKVSLVVLNTLIDACCRDGNMTSAGRIFEDMTKEDSSENQPDLITYSTLVKGYSAAGQLDQAMEIFHAMRRRGIKPDAIVFNSLLDGCARKGMNALCEQVVKDMASAGVQPSNYSASILIKLHGRAGDLDASFEVFNTMPKLYGFKPNIQVYTTLMASCTWLGRMDLALDLRRRLIEDGFKPDAKMYATLMKGGVRHMTPDYLSILMREALSEQKGKWPRLLDEKFVTSALEIIHKQHAWEKEGGRELLALLRDAGYNCVDPTAENPEANNSWVSKKASRGSTGRWTQPLAG